MALSFLLVCSQCCIAAAGTNTMSVGDWSETVNGLRGRLVISGEGRWIGNVRETVVYLELQNALNINGPMEIFYNTVNPLESEVLDSSGKPPPPTPPCALSIQMPSPYWIVIPYDSTLRFRVSTSGYTFASKQGGVSVGLGGIWLIPAESRDDYFLSATFAVSPPQGTQHLLAWKGVLRLAKTKIPRAGLNQ